MRNQVDGNHCQHDNKYLYYVLCWSSDEVVVNRGPCIPQIHINHGSVSTFQQQQLIQVTDEQNQVNLSEDDNYGLPTWTSMRMWCHIHWMTTVMDLRVDFTRSCEHHVAYCQDKYHQLVVILLDNLLLSICCFPWWTAVQLWVGWPAWCDCTIRTRVEEAIVPPMFQEQWVQRTHRHEPFHILDYSVIKDDIEGW